MIAVSIFFPAKYFSFSSECAVGYNYMSYCIPFMYFFNFELFELVQKDDLS